MSPVAVPYASGPAFPQGRANGNPPDSQYAAERAIDRDPATFCCLLNDSLTGSNPATIPARAAAPVTGHMVFDLGRPMLVSGMRITGRKDAGGMNPKDVDCFYFAEDRPAAHRAVADLEHDSGIKPMARHAVLPALAPGANHTVFWDGVIARYVGLRVNQSYESGGGGIHYNYQIAEIEFLADPVDPRLLEARNNPSDRARRLREVRSLRAAIDDLSRSMPGRYRGQEFSRRLDVLEREGETAQPADTWQSRLDALKREALVASNPLLTPGKLLFVKRYTYTPGWYYAEFMRASRFGGGLYVLSLPDGKLTPLATELAGGIFDRFELSFDAQRVIFAHKAAPGRGFRLWEVGIDGRGLKQLTFDPPDEPQRVAKYWHPAYKDSGVYRHHTDDFHPCYLPDGGIAFASTRCERGVLCDQSDSLAVNLLYRMNADGSGMRMLSQGALSESTPSVMNDGRILYTRWEYVDKGVIAVQALWAMRPDGSGTAEIYGDDVDWPPVLIHGRAIPGMDHLFVATATMHHPFAVGPILRIDARRDVRTLEPVWSLTPDTDLCVEGKHGEPHAEHYAHVRGDRLVKDDCGPLFAEPYPLVDPQTGAGAGKYFLVTCNPDRPWHDASAYGLWLIDAFGNRVPIYHDPQISSWQPVPLRPRPRPPVIPPISSLARTERAVSHSVGLASLDPPYETYESREDDKSAKHATVVLSDVYAGLEGVPRGTIKYLRILEQVPRPWSARRFWPNDSAHGQHAVVGLNSHIHVKIHHGIVPVREDGSACFTAPAGKNLFFQALDAEFLEVQRMRSFVNFQPGEVRSCVGCHHYRPKAPAGGPPLALRSPPDRPRPQPGETVPRPIHYPTDVQPILDRHCTRCHNDKRADGGLDLSGTMTEYFSRSYESLLTRQLVACVQEFYGPQPDAQVTNTEPLPPRALGSHASRLMTIVRHGHYDAKLRPEELVRLATWIDANGPYYGTYFGRRNWTYKHHPDFRPTPTLRSAAGIGP